MTYIQKFGKNELIFRDVVLENGTYMLGSFVEKLPIRAALICMSSFMTTPWIWLWDQWNQSCFLVQTAFFILTLDVYNLKRWRRSYYNTIPVKLPNYEEERSFWQILFLSCSDRLYLLFIFLQFPGVAQDRLFKNLGDLHYSCKLSHWKRFFNNISGKLPLPEWAFLP